MKTELSLAWTTLTDAGRSRWICGISARTPSATSSGLAVALRITPVLIDGTPLSRTRLRSLGGGLLDARHVAQPHRVAVDGLQRDLARTARTVFRSVRAVTLNSRCSLSMRPAGTSRFCRRSASSTSCTVSR